MADFRIFSVLFCLSTITALAGCSTSPARTESASARPGYHAPATSAKVTPERTDKAAPVATAATPKPATSSKAAPASKPAPTPQPAASRPATTTANRPTRRPTPAPASTPVAAHSGNSTKVSPRPVSPAPAAKPAPKPAATVAPAPSTAKPAPAPAAQTSTAAEPKPTVALLDTTQPSRPAAETLAVSLDNMPLNIRDEWILDRNESRCVLKSAAVQMDDGQGGTSVSLLIAPGNFTVNTQSDIDLSYKDTGLQIDGGRHFELETIEARTNLRFNKQRQAILDSMLSGTDLRLTLGFWPTWPITNTYSVDIPLAHFATAMKAWDTCNRLLSRK